MRTYGLLGTGDTTLQDIPQFERGTLNVKLESGAMALIGPFGQFRFLGE